MPIFNNDLPAFNNSLEGFPEHEDIYKGKVLSDTLHPSVPNLNDEFGEGTNTMDVQDVFRMNSVQSGPIFGSTISELEKNKRYDFYKPGVNYEDIYARTQPWYKQIGNGLVKMGAFAVGTFAQSFNSIPETAAALAKQDLSELSGNNSYVEPIDGWMKNFEDAFPNYYSDYEKAHPFKSILGSGFANFLGDKFAKNLGFMGGAIAGAVVQDIAIGAVTEGLGEIPLVANQIGKASLYLNKLFSTETAAGRVLGATEKGILTSFLQSGTKAGRTTEQLARMESLAQLAASKKLNNQFRYGLNLWTSALTEGGVESRDGYRTLKQDLIDQHKLDNFGQAPSGKDLQDIEDIATSSMNARLVGNLGILLVSNAIQFENILKPFSSSRTGITSPIYQEIAGKRVALQDGLMGGYSEIVPKSILGKVSRKIEPYVPEILSEGVYEEGGQYALEKGTYAYYNKKYLDQKNNKSRDDIAEFINALGKGMEDQFTTTEGLENMFIGALTAGVIGKAKSVVDNVKGVGSKAQIAAELNNLNSHQLTGVFQNNFENAAQQLQASKDMEAATKNKDVFNYKNAQYKALFSYVNARLKSNRFGLLEEEIKLAKELPDDQFKQMFGFDANADNRKVANEYLSLVQTEANKIKDNHDKINEFFTNPYKYIRTPKTDEEIAEQKNYNDYEDYKTAMTFFPSLMEHMDKREASISQELYKINSSLSTSLVKKVGSVENLLGLAKEYEDDAKSYINLITENTTPEDRRNFENKAKDLRKFAEDIYSVSRKTTSQKEDATSDYLKLSNAIINFEMNGRDNSLKDTYIKHPLDVEKTLTFAIDLNKIDDARKEGSEAFDILSDPEKGFEEYRKVNETRFAPEHPEGSEISAGREYETEKLGKYKVKKIDDDRYQIIGPDNTIISTHSDRKEASATSKYLNNNLQSLKKVKAIRDNGDGTVRIVDLNGDIQDIPKTEILKYTRLETEEEKLAKDKETLDKELEKLTPTGTTVETSPAVAGEYIGSEDKRKDVDRLFVSGTSISEDSGGEQVNNQPHIKRARTFLNNFKFFKNKDKMKLILVTPNNAKALGLNGIIQLNYGKPISDSLTDEETNVDLGFMAQVFILQTPEGDFFVNEKGEKLNKVGEESDTILDNVVFQTMSSASLYTVGGYEKARKGQEEEAENALEAYKIFRQDVFSQEGYTPYSFSISRGIPKQNKVNGEYEDNHIGDILGPDAEKIIAQENGLIKVVTTGMIEHDAELLSFPIGTTLVQYGDLLDYANNKTVTNKQANNIVGVIDALAKDLFSKIGTPKAGKIDYNYFKFLNNVLYFKFDGNTQTPSQIGIDTNTMEFKIGDKSFPLSKIQENKKEIMNALQDAFISVNNKTLAEGTSKTFTEYVVDKDGQLKPVVWKNYQSFLLSSKNPDGSSRSTEETPLITHTTKATDNTTQYKQKYAYITDKDILPYDRVPVKEAKPAPAATTPGVTKIGEYEVNTGKEQSLEVGSGPVLFTVTLSPEGAIDVDIKDNETTEALSTNQEKLNQIDSVLTKDMSSDELKVYNKKLNKEKVNLYLYSAIKQMLEKEYATQLEAGQKIPEEVYEAFTEEAEESRQQSIDEEQATLEKEKPYDPSKKKRRGDTPEYRMVGKNDVERMTNSDLEEFKKWHAEKVPFIPFDVLEQMIQVNDNEEAWGVFEKGVAKFVKGGLRGTEYHEIGHGIWTMLSSAEQEALLNEFRSKPGTFTDRASGKQIEHADATDTQAEERIWDDFSDFRLGKLPARTLGERVRRLFKMIMDFFKSFGVNPSLKDELFKSIEAGRFKETKLSERAKTMAPKYRIEGLTEEQTNNYINDVVFQVSRIIFREGNKELLFNPEKLTGNEVFAKVRKEYESLGEIDALGEKRYNELVKRSIEFLRTIGVTFNAEDVVSINNEEANNREYVSDPFSTDWKQYSTGALKFLLSTLAERKSLNQTKVQKGKDLKPAAYNLSNEGYKLLNFNRVFATLFDRLHNTNDPQEFTDKFIQLAKEDSNYLPLFVSLGGNINTHKFNFDTFGESDWRLFIQFFNTFTRQKPEALIQYTNKEGEVFIGNANMFTTVNQTVDSWVDNMKAIGKAPGGLISFDKKVYTIDRDAIKNISIKKSNDMIAFLNKLGIEFNQATYDALSDKETIIKGNKTTEVKEFTDAVNRIYTQLGKNNQLMTFDAKRLDINGPLRTLASLYIKVNNPNQDSTYFGVEGQRIGSFSENNAPSYFENTFNESKTLTELLEKMPQLNDVYSRGSEILKLGGLFFDEDGNRIAEIKVEYIQGGKNEFTGKDKPTSKLTEGERFMQEINQNVNGKYYVLIPGDSSTEWMMNLGNVISMDDIKSGNYWNKVYSIYSNYLNDDINLALADRKQNLYQRPRAQELRIMRDILSEDVVEDIEDMIKEGSTYDAIQEYISKNKEDIDKSVKDFLEGMSKQTFNILQDSNQIISLGEDSYAFYYNLDSEFAKKYKLQGEVSYDEVMSVLNFVNINYAINNQEYHKILFGDPYQFKTEKGKLDETKRVKSFLSPRRRTFDMPEYNNFLNRTYNSVNGIDLEEGTPGYHEYKEYTNTVTFDNVNIVGSIAMMPNVSDEIKEAFAKTDETDAMSWLMDNTHKEIALKEGQWSNEAEAFHQWHMAYTRRAFDKKGIKKYTSEQLKARDAKLLESPMPKYKLAVRKPIISGNKANKTEIDLVLDKTSQMPLYYNMVENTALGTMYEQMFDQKIGYAIVISGRKVGTEGLHNIYVDGKVNTAPFNSIIEVPWSIYGTQVETMSEGEKTQTRGSQLTKLSSMDLFNNGEVIGDTPERKEVIKKAYDRNKKALDMLNKNGYNELLNKLGVVDLGDGFALEDKQRISETLMYEMMRRDLSENAKDTIQLDENGEFIMPFEASPSYTQIKNILYSMVNKALTSPSMNGAPHVQAPVTMFENAEEGRGFARKTDKGWVKITKTQYEALSDEDKKDVRLTDDTLKFYEDEDGKRYCEVMLPSWFKSKLKKGKFKDYTDQQLIDYLNKTTDGKKILTGVGFRIPTQALSSVEVFKVKEFLPEYMGYTVIVPSEITTKAGSDFDIDKLNMYLKSIYIDRTGDIKLVKYLGSEEATKAFFAKNFDEVNQGRALIKSELLEAVDTLIYGLEDTKGLLDKYGNFILSIQDQYADPFAFRAEIEKELENLTDENLKAELKEREVNNMYRRSLENEYYDSLEEILTLPENFNKLISPVDDAGLEKISEVLDKARGYNETNIKGRLVNRNFMTKMRHAFITGKRWVGIAAVNITNLSLRQKSKVYLDPSKLPILPKNERKFVKDLSIVVPHNTLEVDGQTYVSLSGTRTADLKQFISQRLSGYATAFVDIANKPFITKIIKSDVVVSTFMFLESIGAGNTGIYFLNQPIIEKYLEYLDSINSKSVTGTKNLKYIRSLFPTTDKAMEDASISVEQLLENIKEYSKEGKFDQAKNAEQQLILTEFIKYKILADQLFSYTQATNYDTTKFGSSDSLLKKEWGTFNASNFNLISNVEDVLDKTFIGKQADLLSKAFSSFGAIMKTELPEIKAYTLSTLKRYATRKYMSMDDYEKIANLIKNSFLDYIIQNNTTMSNMVKPLLVDSETAVVTQLEKAKQKYPSMQILQDLVPVVSTREGGANSIKLKVNSKDAYSENLYVGMMREMRDTPELNSLYNNIINVAILQGTSQSAISIRNIIPVEDYAAKIAPIIQQLRPSTSLEAFSNGMFERNNFANEDVFKEFTPYVYTPQPNPDTKEYHPNSVRLNPNTGEDELIYSFFAFREMRGVTKTSRRLLALNDVYNSFQLDNDFIKIPKVVTNKDGLKINMATGLEVTKKDYALMKEKGSQDLYDNYYYKKVYTNQVDEFNNLIPLRTYNEKIDGYDYYYKLINVYGDGNRAVEINTDFTPSVINNGSLRIKEELNDIDIVNALAPQVQEEIVPLPTEETVITEDELGLNTDFNQDDFKC